MSKRVFVGLKAVAWVSLALLVAFGATWGGIRWYRFFGPKREAARREVFKSTRSYQEGKEQDLSRLRLQYFRARSDEERNVIASTIRHQFADFGEQNLDSPELRAFLAKIKRGE